MQQLLKQSYVKYGLIMSGLIAVCLGLMEITGSNQSFGSSPLSAGFSFFAPVVVWYLGIKAKKDQQKGKLTFKQGLKEGFKISLVYGLTSPFVFLFYYLFVNPEILNYVRATYNMATSSDLMVMTVDLAAQLLSAIIFGTLYGAVISFFLRSKS